jgi:adenosylcobyric acid synthase
MVLGTTSDAGKSWLATALCRWYARQGLKVAPFKAQNMSNNARVVPGLDDELGEIGSAQYFQALAARALPEVRMNPVLLKPERDTASQVVVMGRVRADLAAMPWRERSERLWPFARDALHALRAENDVLVLEGAGSPAEINLHASDYVNMRSALETQAQCLLVTDIDRGGAFAHLFGTHQLLLPAERTAIRGFVLNRFRGDASLLAPGPQQLQRLTGVPTVAVLPMWREHGLPEEDGVLDETATSDGTGPVIAVVAYPHISNLDEFQPLRTAGSVRLRWARTPAALEGADWVVLPGSKHTSGDLAWLRAQGLHVAIARHAAAGRRVLGICGGLQMLGAELRDPHGVDGAACGLDLLPLTTQFGRHKLLRHTRARFDALAGEWALLSRASFDGYEIRHGRSDAAPGTCVALRNAAGEPIGWQQGSVMGLYAHGLFESPLAMQALFGATVRTLDGVFDGLADFIDHHFDSGVLHRLVQP